MAFHNLATTLFENVVVYLARKQSALNQEQLKALK